MPSRTEKSISASGLIRSGDRILVALSGGPDSVCLLFALSSLKNQMGFELAAAHFNHMIRDTALRDELFCRELCARLSVPFFSTRSDVPAYAEKNGLSLETAARILRYDYLVSICKKQGFCAVATAHQQNDNAESVLMHLIRGSGLTGLIGIREQNMLKGSGIRLIRPLLGVSKAEILAYLDERGEGYCEDETNSNTDAARNYLRLEIMPRIEENINSSAMKNVCRTANILAEDEEYLLSIARAELEKARTGAGYNRRSLDLLPPPIKKRCIRLILDEKTTAVDVEENHILKIAELLRMNSGAGIDIPHSRVRVSFDDLIAEWAEKEKTGENGENTPIVIRIGENDTPFGIFRLSFLSETEPIAMEKSGELEYNIKKLSGGYTALVDAEALEGPLSVRTRRPGDRFRPLNCPYSMKLKDYFIGKRVDEKLRSMIPLVLSGERIIFIPGFTVSDEVKLKTGARKILRIEYEKHAGHGE